MPFNVLAASSSSDKTVTSLVVKSLPLMFHDAREDFYGFTGDEHETDG